MGKKKNDKKRHPHLKHLDRVGELTAIAKDKTAKKSTRKAAKAELERLRVEGERLNEQRDAARQAQAQTAEQIDAEIRARLEVKRAERAAGLAQLQADVAENRERRIAAAEQPVDDAEPTPEATPVAKPVKAQKADDAKPAKVKSKKAKKVERKAEAGDGDDDAQGDTVRETVEVEQFGLPSEAPKRWEDDTNGNGQYKVMRPSDGKIVGYTRVTTYIDALEDKTMLTKWKMRVLLEGVAAAEEPDIDGKAEPVTARIRELAHVRDVAIAKARKRDRKGKLVHGQLAVITQGAWSDFKRAMDALADELFEIGGGREKATKGTDLHALVDLYDAEGIEAVQDKLDAEEITPSDFADVQAYARATKALGLKVVHAEAVIVNDDLKVAGRLDRIFMAKLPAIHDPKTGEVIRPADVRARRYVGDLKTGNVEYSLGKIAQQIRLYADGEIYDPETHERSSHRASKSVGLLIHLPAGSAQATIHLVDLGVGGEGNRIVGQVRAFRNTGKRAIDLKTDLVAIADSGNQTP